MIYLNVGNLWQNEYLDEVIQLNKEHKEDEIKVASMFGSIAFLTPTARAFDRLPQRNWSFVEQYIEKAQRNDIQIRYTLNQSCIGPIQDFHTLWETGLRLTIKELHDIGVHEWTITSPLLLELVRNLYPNDFIEVSTIAEVSTIEDAMRWMELGADGINASTSINRDFLALESLTHATTHVSLLANEACLFRCPWRRECYNLSSHNSSRSEELFGFYPFRRCTEMRIKDPAEWLKARLILPQWMKTYQRETSINWFKIAYRTHPIEVAIPMLRRYMSQEFHGNLLELWPTITHLGNTEEPKVVTHISTDELDWRDFLEHFMIHGDKCSGTTCKKCGYCDRMYQDAKR